MKYENVVSLRRALIGKTIVDVEAHGGHGMVLTITATSDREPGVAKIIDICTYDDGNKHGVDEFYVALNGEEL